MNLLKNLEFSVRYYGDIFKDAARKTLGFVEKAGYVGGAAMLAGVPTAALAQQNPAPADSAKVPYAEVQPVADSRGANLPYRILEVADSTLENRVMPDKLGAVDSSAITGGAEPPQNNVWSDFARSVYKNTGGYWETLLKKWGNRPKDSPEKANEKESLDDIATLVVNTYYVTNLLSNAFDGDGRPIYGRDIAKVWKRNEGLADDILRYRRALEELNKVQVAKEGGESKEGYRWDTQLPPGEQIRLSGNAAADKYFFRFLAIRDALLGSNIPESQYNALFDLALNLEKQNDQFRDYLKFDYNLIRELTDLLKKKTSEAEKANARADSLAGKKRSFFGAAANAVGGVELGAGYQGGSNRSGYRLQGNVKVPGIPVRVGLARISGLNNSVFDREFTPDETYNSTTDVYHRRGLIGEEGTLSHSDPLLGQVLVNVGQWWRFVAEYGRMKNTEEGTQRILDEFYKGEERIRFGGGTDADNLHRNSRTNVWGLGAGRETGFGHLYWHYNRFGGKSNVGVSFAPNLGAFMKKIKGKR